MSTLVEWLRTAAKARSDIDAYLHGEAADEIGRLTAATVRMTEEINHLRQERERLRADLQFAYENKAASDDTWRKECERLRAALTEIGHVMASDPLEGRDIHAEILAIIGEALADATLSSRMDRKDG